MPLDRHRSIETFIEKFEKFYVKDTIRHYRGVLKNFFKTIGKNPNTYIVDIKKLDGEERENTIKTYEEDVEKFWLALKNRSPKSRSGNISSVRTFLSEFNIELSTKFWKDIHRRSPPAVAITDDIAPTNEQMKRILQHADLRAKALFLVLDSSGMRINEVLQLEPEDIKLENDPVRINVRMEITKTKQRRITFMSNEARDTLIEWLNVRDEWLETAVKRCNLVPSHERHEDGSVKMVPVKKNPDDTRVFPFSPGNARGIWNTLLKKAGLAEQDKRTNYHKMHLHCMRKRFSTKMPGYISDNGRDITETLMGHAGYLTGPYRRFSEEDLAEGYKKGVNGLLIFEKGEDIQKMRDLQEKNKAIGSVINLQAEKIDQLSSEKEQRVQEVKEIVQEAIQNERESDRSSPEKVQAMENNPKFEEVVTKAVMKNIANSPEVEEAVNIINNVIMKNLVNDPKFRKEYRDMMAAGMGVKSPEVQDKAFGIETKKFRRLRREDKRKEAQRKLFT